MKFKTLLTLTLISCSYFLSFGQDKGEWGIPIDSETKKIVFTGVVEAPELTKDQLFDNAYNWLKNYFVAVDKKIYVKDKAAGKIQLKTHIQLYKMERKQKVKDSFLKYKIDLFFKDGKYKYKLYNFIYTRGNAAFHIERWMNEANSTPEDAKRRYTSLDKEMEKLIAELKEGLKHGPVKKTDDW